MLQRIPTPAIAALPKLKGLGQRVVREGLWIACGHAVVALAGIASIRLYTELAPQSVFGGANLLLGVVLLGSHVFVAPITQTQLRFHTAYANTGEADSYTLSILRLTLAAALVVGAITSAVLIAFPEARAGAGADVIGWLALWALLSTAKGVLAGRANAERRRRLYALWLASDAVLTVVCTAGMLSIWPTIPSFLAGNAIAVAIGLMVFGVPQLRSIVRAAQRAPDLSQRVRHQIVAYGSPFALFAALGWLSNLSDRYVLAGYMDTAAVGLYAAAFAIASRLPALPGGLLNDIFRPILFGCENSNDTAAAQRVLAAWILCLAAVLVSIVGFLFVAGDLVAYLLLAAPYRAGAREVMSWIAVGYGAVVLTQVLENRILSFNASRALLGTKLAGAGANLLGAIALIPTHGIMGAAYANALGQGLQLCATIVLLRRVTTQRAVAA